MIYRLAVLSTILMAGMRFAIPAYGAGDQAWVFKGTCSSGILTSHPLNYGTLSESDGVQVVASGMSGKDYHAAMERARAAHLTLGSDGFLWATQPVQCDSALVWVKANSNSKGDTLVSFSDGDLSKPVLAFTGVPIDGDGPLFSPDSVYVGDGKPAMQLNPNGNEQSCHFYFTDHGTFTQGWETRLATIDCNARVKRADGHLISVDVRFDSTKTPGPATVDKGSSPSPKTAPAAPTPDPNALLVLSGSGSKSTQTVTVPREWKLEWSYDCSNFPASQGAFQVFIYNSDGSAADASIVNQMGARGSDTEYYHQGGNLYFVINSTCQWTLKALR